MRLGRWRDQRRYAKQFREMGLTRDEVAAMKEMDRDTLLDRFAQIQDENKARLNAAGFDTDSLVPQIGQHIQWIDITQMVFRVVNFDRNGTTVDLDAGPQSVKARSEFASYGYLLVESPTLNQPVQLPIIHRADFYLASTIFDDPTFSFPEGAELLVTYAPKKMSKEGFSKGPHHVLHYALVSQGTLERYYSDDEIGDRRMSKPELHLIFGLLKYDGMISVITNTDPQF
jgi:hypothetical protein